MRATYPMLLDVGGRTIVIVGGGKVAVRKARGLIDAGAERIRCVAPEFNPELAPQVERVSEEYRAEHLDGASLVIAATDRPRVNEAVVRDAHARGLLVNRADNDDEPADFSTPAKLQRGDLMIMVSAGSPALAAMIRDRLAQLLDPRWEKMAEAMRKLRPAIKESGAPIETRRKVFHALTTEDALAILDQRGFDALWDWLRHRFAELHHA